jgi:hypothetical protein
MVHMCGTITSRATSKRSPSRPPFQRTSARSGIYMSACGERVVSISAFSPAEAGEAPVARTRVKRTDDERGKCII